jgi:hypothetical protein
MSRSSPSALIALLVAAAAPARAQQHGEVRGMVRTAIGDPVPYAVVSLSPGFTQRFTNDSGDFHFFGVRPGRYRLLARQIGYQPESTTVVVVADSVTDVTVSLEHLTVELSEINVVEEKVPPLTPWRCSDPGPPDPTRDQALGEVFEQLRQNAERYWLLADSYPVLYRMVRRTGYVDRAGRAVLTSGADTVSLRTDSRWHYAPGHLVAEFRGPSGGTELQANLPTLPDLADTAFQRTHCFRLAGVDTLEGGRYLRVDFRAADRLLEPDADGAVYLDTATYVIRYATVRLTHPERVTTGLAGLTATERFREIASALVIVDSISSDQEGYEGLTRRTRVEEQRLLDLFFLRPLPRARRDSVP